MMGNDSKTASVSWTEPFRLLYVHQIECLLSTVYNSFLSFNNSFLLLSCIVYISCLITHDGLSNSAAVEQ